MVIVITREPLKLCQQEILRKVLSDLSNKNLTKTPKKVGLQLKYLRKMHYLFFQSIFWLVLLARTTIVKQLHSSYSFGGNTFCAKNAFFQSLKNYHFIVFMPKP